MLRNIEFLTTVAETHALPPPHGTEVAFVGRSNAGKSSAINALTQRKRMAFVSKTPGRTQHINFFRVAPGRYLVDLPGYGYAAVPVQEKARWNQLVGDYLRGRSSLRGVVLIMDIRHPLRELDLQLLEWIRPAGTEVHVLLTKADKLGNQQAAATLRDVESRLREYYPGCSVQLFSSPRKIGLAEAAKKLGQWLQADKNKGCFRKVCC